MNSLPHLEQKNAGTPNIISGSVAAFEIANRSQHTENLSGQCMSVQVTLKSFCGFMVCKPHWWGQRRFCFFVLLVSAFHRLDCSCPHQCGLVSFSTTKYLGLIRLFLHSLGLPIFPNFLLPINYRGIHGYLVFHQVLP